jgi:multidrug efflux pump subunit AcrA (membrane-fusion protein)
LGQEVLITLDALPDEEISGRVEAIAPTATSVDAGVVSYVVTVAIEPTDALLRSGMSANTTITTDRKENALLVPNRYIQIDRENGKMYVERLEEDGFTSRVEIETGMRDEFSSEVVAGLEEGDTLVLRSLSGRERLERTFSGPSD